MYRRSVAAYSFVVVACSWLAFGSSSLGSDFSKFLHGVFADQYQRNPSGAELNYHANLGRTQGPLENYIAICSTDDFFINQARGNYEVYVTRLYQVFLGRNCRPDELQYWVVQFQRSGVSRLEMVRRFCTANLVTQLPTYLPSQPVYTLPSTAGQVADELVSRANLFVSMLQGEIGYSSYGQSVIRQAQQFTSVAEQYRQVVRSTSLGPQVNIAVGNLEQSLQALETVFYRVPGASPHSQSVLQQISQLVPAARNALARRPQQPIVEPPSSSSPGYAEIVTLRDMVRQFEYGLQSHRYQQPVYTNLYRDVQGLLVQVESVELMMRQGRSSYEIRTAMQNVLTQSNQISSDMTRTDLRIQQEWWNLQVQLRRAANTVGVGGNAQILPANPVIINRPSWGQFPFQPTPNVPSSRNQESIRVADELILKIDGYIASLQPASVQNSYASQLIASLQNLKHSVLIFRQTAASGAFGNTLSRSSDMFAIQYQRTAAEFTRLVTADSTLNSPLFYQIGELTRQLQNAARGILS